MVTHHLLDALAVLPHLPQRDALRVLDVGSGGGVPGIPLAIARPHGTSSLLDATTRRPRSCTQAVDRAAAAQRRPRRAQRVEDYAPAAPFDIVISRAFADLATFVDASRGISRPTARWSR